MSFLGQALASTNGGGAAAAAAARGYQSSFGEHVSTGKGTWVNDTLKSS